jgi:hypothetical protein
MQILISEIRLFKLIIKSYFLMYNKRSFTKNSDPVPSNPCFSQQGSSEDANNKRLGSIKIRGGHLPAKPL